MYTYPIAEDKVHAHKNQEVIIPCKPSLKSTEITLVKYPPVRVIVSGEDKTPPVVQPGFASFDPKYGFRISKYDNSMRGLYKCSSPTFIAAPGGSNAKSYELRMDSFFLFVLPYQKLRKTYCHFRRRCSRCYTSQKECHSSIWRKLQIHM